MLKRMLLVAASTCMMSTGALATNAACPAVPNGSIIDNSVLATALKLAVAFKKHPLPLALNLSLLVTVLVGVAGWHQPLALVLLPLAAVSYGLTWRRLLA